MITDRSATFLRLANAVGSGGPAPDAPHGFPFAVRVLYIEDLQEFPYVVDRSFRVIAVGSVRFHSYITLGTSCTEPRFDSNFQVSLRLGLFFSVSFIFFFSDRLAGMLPSRPAYRLPAVPLLESATVVFATKVGSGNDLRRCVCSRAGRRFLS